MEENIKVRVTHNYNDLVTKEFYTAGTIRFLNQQRARELEKRKDPDLIIVMEVRKCKYE